MCVGMQLQLRKSSCRNLEYGKVVNMHGLHRVLNMPEKA